MNKRILEVVNYNPAWKINFNKEQTLLLNIIGSTAISIEHIGSTAIPGLCAKPIIDVLVEVPCLKKLDEQNQHLEALGYLVMGENGMAGRRYFQKGGNQRTHHVHAFETGDANLIRHRAFKEYLMAHPNALTAYAKIKQQALENCNNEIKRYMALKNDFIQHHEQLALSWYAQ